MWTAQAVSIIGTWMQLVGAQWYIVERSPDLAAFVQTAMAVPMVALALPAGALADIVDRRRLLLLAQSFQVVVALAMAVLAATELLTPAFLLALTALLAVGTAANAPAWQAVSAESVPREQLSGAATLNALSVNVGRAVGPAIGGLVVALVGPAGVFFLNAASFSVAIFVAARWRGQPVSDRDRERLLEALRAGGRYIRFSRVSRRVMGWIFVFTFLSTGMWALLPLVANQRFGLGSGGYGALLGAVGVGAVIGAMLLPRLRQSVNQNRLVSVSFLIEGVCLVAMALIGPVWLAGCVLVPAGAAFIVVISSCTAVLQLSLPGWVRARGLALLLTVNQAATALGAAVFGLLGGALEAGIAIAVAGAALCVAAPGLRWLPMPDISRIDQVVSQHWAEPALVVEPSPRDGPVTVTTRYRVPAAYQGAFIEAMVLQGRSRRRTGALSHSLVQDGADPELFLEIYLVATWAEHMRQHDERMTGTDRQIEAAARAYVVGEVVTHHWFPPHAPDVDED
ncbi:MAG: MFS transporter [Actinomycetota bacterium]|nr:MAG: MFS transporter [Actinomycetota bacterium]